VPRGPDRTLDVLLLFREAPAGGLGVTEIAEALGLYKSMAHRILAALEERGLVRQDLPGRRYRLGYSALALAGSFIAATPLVQAALPELERLEQACGAPAALYVADGPEQVCLAATGAALAALGERRPLLPAAPGMVLLAYADAVERGGLLGALANRVELDPGAMAVELERVRRQGWAAGGGAVAAPVWRGRSLLAALAVRSDDAERCVPALARAAAAIFR